MRRRPALAAAAALALSTSLVGTAFLAPAQAATLQHWTGKVTKVADGDTIYVDVAGDGTSTPKPVRLIGIQATEMHGDPYDGGRECGAQAATDALTAFLPVGAKVRLSAYHASSTLGKDPHGVPRLFRYVDRWNASTGTWQDAQLVILDKGLAFWLRSAVEIAHSASYHKAMQKAVAARRGLFSGTACGSGPAQSADLRLWLNYDAEDESAANGEYMRIQNHGASAVSLAGWHLRDPSHHFWKGQTYWTFPSGASVAAGRTITVYFGSGTTSVAGGRYYLAIKGTHYLPNDDAPGSNSSGHTIILQDPQLDVRGLADYPCTVSCRAPKVHISDVVRTGSDERVDLQVDGGVSATQDLSGIVVWNDGLNREIDPGTALAAGETLRVYLDRHGTDTRLVQYWPQDGPVLTDAGDTVILRTDWSNRLDTYSWGSG